MLQLCFQVKKMTENNMKKAEHSILTVAIAKVKSFLIRMFGFAAATKPANSERKIQTRATISSRTSANSSAYRLVRALCVREISSYKPSEDK